MKDNRLRNAMIAGTLSLAFSVPTLSILGVLAFILSWKAYSRPKRGTASAAGAAYIAAALAGTIFALILISGGAGLAANAAAHNFGAPGFTRFMKWAGIFMLAGDALYIPAAVLSIKGGRALPESSSDNNGFFD